VDEVFSNYRELVRPMDAEAWFGIAPAAVERVKAESGKQNEEADNIIALPGYGGLNRKS
jgi:hypothetical protein